jgi:hypothetical protein
VRRFAICCVRVAFADFAIMKTASLRIMIRNPTVPCLHSDGEMCMDARSGERCTVVFCFYW